MKNIDEKRNIYKCSIDYDVSGKNWKDTISLNTKINSRKLILSPTDLVIDLCLVIDPLSEVGSAGPRLYEAVNCSHSFLHFNRGSLPITLKGEPEPYF